MTFGGTTLALPPLRSQTRSFARSSKQLRGWPSGRKWGAPDKMWPDLRSVLAHPYTVFYRVTEVAIEIVRVLHERRDFPAILKKDES